MQWSDDLRIETPEQIDVSLELAGLGSRFVARIWDWVFKWGFLVVVAILGGILFAVLDVSADTKLMQISFATVLLLIFYSLLLAYDVYFEVRHNGQTPGKKWAGVRVLRESGAPVDFRSSCIRNLLGMADMLPVGYLLGALLVQLTSRHQRLGDLAAGTIVIRERALEVPDDPAEEFEYLASADVTFTADQLAACFPDGPHILRSFFQRYDELDETARGRLARRLAVQFAGKTASALSAHLTSHEAEVYLASLYRDLEQFKQHDR